MILSQYFASCKQISSRKLLYIYISYHVVNIKFIFTLIKILYDLYKIVIELNSIYLILSLLFLNIFSSNLNVTFFKDEYVQIVER